MCLLTWFKDLLPEQLPVKQVYGIAFSNDKREYIEELNIELEDIYYLGYLLVEEYSDKYAQVRMIAKIKDIHDSHIDPATGKIYGRSS